VKVLDFGLAKAFEPDGSSSAAAASVNSPTLTLEATRAGMLLGTAAYMSPEQARGKTVDKRTDIWAFGVVLYEMLTGRMMFEGETLSDTLAGVLRAPFDWSALPADTPSTVRHLLERCLERDPKRRLRDIGDAWTEVEAPAIAALPPARRAWLPWTAAAIVAAGGIAWGLLRVPAIPSEPVTRWTYTQSNIFMGLSLTPDGTRLAYYELVNSVPRLMLRNLDQPESKPIPGGESALAPFLSPDGQWVAFVQLANSSLVGLKKFPISGGTPISIADNLERTGVAWLGDDVVFSLGKALVRTSASGAKIETLTNPDISKGERSHGWPSILPGKQALLFSIVTVAGSQIAVFDLKSRQYRILLQDGAVPRYVPTGHLVFYRNGMLLAAPFDVDSLKVTGTEVPVVENVAPYGAGGADYAIANTGLLAYMQGASFGGGTVLKWADRKGAMQSITDIQLWGTGRLSPDGKRIANEIAAGRQGDIWSVELERNTKTRLTFGGVNSYPVWTPDGKWITYDSEVQGKHALSRVAADGSGKPEVLLPLDSFATPHSWSPDGKTLVYSQVGADKVEHLWSVTLQPDHAAPKPVQLHDTPTAELDGQISPDGHWLAYESVETGSSEIYVQAFPGLGAKTRISTQGGSTPRWSRDGAELIYRTPEMVQDVLAVPIQRGDTLRVGTPQSLFRCLCGTTFDIGPDGKRFLTEQNDKALAGSKMVAVVNWFDELRRRVPVKR
jgi:serine/threonine-protein kinase